MTCHCCFVDVKKCNLQKRFCLPLEPDSKKKKRFNKVKPKQNARKKEKKKETKKLILN